MGLLVKPRSLLRQLSASVSYAVILSLAAASAVHADNAVSAAHAITIDALNPSRIYRVETVRITGNQHFSASELSAAMATKTRPFYELWKKRPQFDPETFTDDLNQLRLFYQSHGYYNTHIAYSLEIHGNLITPHIEISEGRPVEVDKVSVELTEPGPRPQTLQSGFALPLQPG